MKRIARYLFGAALLIGALAYAYLHGVQAWPETVAVIVGALAGPTVALGPDIYGVDRVKLPGGSAIDFGDDDCDHDGGGQ
ncbi:MAG: hypothetical protein ABEN55_13555 [Bradymonadaceae bacterium]